MVVPGCGGLADNAELLGRTDPDCGAVMLLSKLCEIFSAKFAKSSSSLSLPLPLLLSLSSDPELEEPDSELPDEESDDDTAADFCSLGVMLFIIGVAMFGKGLAGLDGRLVDVIGLLIGVDANIGFRRLSLIFGEFVADMLSESVTGDGGLISIGSTIASTGLLGTGSNGLTSSIALSAAVLVSSSSLSSSNNSSIPLNMSISKSSSLVLSTSLRTWGSACSRPTFSARIGIASFFSVVWLFRAFLIDKSNRGLSRTNV